MCETVEALLSDIIYKGNYSDFRGLSKAKLSIMIINLFNEIQNAKVDIVLHPNIIVLTQSNQGEY